MGDVVQSEKGSIPAWAGEPYCPIAPLMMIRVYPRVGGGAGGAAVSVTPLEGLSPRGRGSHFERVAVQVCDGSIPAWAGEPL